MLAGRPLMIVSLVKIWASGMLVIATTRAGGAFRRPRASVLSKQAIRINARGARGQSEAA